MENVRVATTRFIGTAGLTQIVRGSKLIDYLELYAKTGDCDITIGGADPDKLITIKAGERYQPNNAFNADIHFVGLADELLVIMDSCSDTLITFNGVQLLHMDDVSPLYLEGYGCNIKGSKPQPLTPPVFK